MIRIWRWALVKLDADPEERPLAATAGRWPSTRQGFLWDLTPDALAPSNDGVVAPRPAPPPWLEAANQSDQEHIKDLLEAERQRHAEARAAAGVAEAKASRLLTPSVALLTGSIALVALQLRSAVTATTPAGLLLLLLCAAPGTVAVTFVFISILRALDADTRVGIYSSAGAAQLVNRDVTALLREEYEAAERARWTARQKTTRLMYARAAISRAIVFLVIALILAASTTVATGYFNQGRAGTKPSGSTSAAPTANPPSPTATGHTATPAESCTGNV
jgi:hypothetical protein